jgi:hypothetical protein
MRFFQFKYLTSRSLLRLRRVLLSAIAYFSQRLIKKLDLLAVTAWSGSFPINIPVLREFVCESLTFFHPSPCFSPAARSGL